MCVIKVWTEWEEGGVEYSLGCGQFLNKTSISFPQNLRRLSHGQFIDYLSQVQFQYFLKIIALDL